MGPTLYRLLVRLLPRAFREEYGAEMVRVAEEHWADAGARNGGRGALRFWGRQCMALLREAWRLRGRTHETRGGDTMGGFLQDLRQAARALIRRPGFALVTLATLGMGIGSATTMFSAVRTVLLRPLPYPDEDRLVQVFQTDVASGERGAGVSAANTRDLHESARAFVAVAHADPWSMDLEVDGRAESLRAWAVSEGFFRALGTETALGRTFVAEEYRPGASPVVLLGHATWLARFGGEPDVVGRSLTLDGGPVTVVGVLPPGFRYPDAAELWIPRPPQPHDDQSRAADYQQGIARLAPGVGLARAQAEADAIARRLREAHPGPNRTLGFELVPLRTHLFGDVRTPLYVVLGAVGVVLLIACANVAGLLLARGAQREREYALRGALGADSARLLRHVTAESLVLAAAGSVVGLLLTWGGVEAIRRLGPEHLPRIDELQVDGTVLLFAVAVAVVSAVGAGLAPSLRLARPELTGALADGARGSSGPAGTRTRGRLVVTEVAAAVVLLVGAGLLGRSFVALLGEDLGFDPDHRLALQLFAYDYAASDSAGMTRGAFIDEVSARMGALPGVSGVALTTNLPSSNDGVIANIEVTVPFVMADGPQAPVDEEPVVAVSQVSPGYFDVMGIALVSGREFGPADDPGGPPVVLVNETFARRHFGADDPLGRSVLIRYARNAVPREIVGVVADTRPLGHASDPVPEAYLPLSQVASGSLTFVLRSEADAGALAQPAREAVWAVNPSQSVWGVATVRVLVADWLEQRRFILFLLSTFSALALLLAAVGIYGLISFSVQRRSAELGIRRALGGRSSDILAMVLAEGGRLAGTGVALGLAAAFVLSRFLQGMLYGVQPTDPLTFAGLAAFVLVVAGAATLVPALRAARLDPIVALRGD